MPTVTLSGTIVLNTTRGGNEIILLRGALGIHGVVAVTEYLSDFIEEFGLWISRRGRPIILSW
jgi:hypothetical protein